MVYMHVYLTIKQVIPSPITSTAIIGTGIVGAGQSVDSILSAFTPTIPIYVCVYIYDIVGENMY